MSQLTFLEQQRIAYTDALLRIEEARALLSTAYAELCRPCMSIQETRGSRMSIQNGINDADYAITQVMLLKQALSTNHVASSVGLVNPTTDLGSSSVGTTAQTEFQKPTV